MIEAAPDRFGRLDVLVANPGIISLGDVQEVSVAGWDEVMAKGDRLSRVRRRLLHHRVVLPVDGGYLAQ
jgi:NADP-dependent 3-hydroxy acid dehydrogenase YdfG